MQNRINAVLSTVDKTQVLQLMQDIWAKLPFLLSLSIEIIKSLSKWSIKVALLLLKP